jgi:ABC-type transport system involved in cytochrome c biogenesis permease subunit
VSEATILLFWLATMLYIVATVLYVYFFVTRNRRMSIAATFATGLGFILHTVAIVLRSILIQGLPIRGLFNSLALFAWFVVLAYFIVEHVVRIKTLGILMLPVAVVLMVIAGSHYDPTNVEGLDRILRAPSVPLHLSAIFVAYASFVLAAGAGILYLLQERQLKRKQVGAFFRRLPSLDVLDDLERKAVSFGVPFLTAGLVLGVIRAMQVLASNWYTDPLVVLALLTWVFYVSYLLLRYYAGWAGQRAAWLAIVGLVLLSGLRVLASGGYSIFHSYGG